MMKRSRGGFRQGRISSPPSKKLKASPVTYQLDDPVLECVKRHLNIGGRIGFEPISQRFARIAVFIKDRMNMKLVGYNYNFESREKDSAQLLVKRQNDVNESPFDITVNNMRKTIRSLFLRIRKWRSVDFTHARFDKRRDDDSDTDFDLGDLDLGNLSVAGQILDAILIQSRATIDIRRISFRGMTTVHQKKVVTLLQRCAPFLRSLVVGLRDDPLPVLLQSIGACQQLRRLVIDAGADFPDFPPSFLPMLLGLEKLDGLRVGGVRPLEIGRHCLSIDFDQNWLQFFAQPALIPLLTKMLELNVEMIIFQSVLVIDLTRIIAKMRSPVRVTIDCGSCDGLTWAVIWNDFLPMVRSTRANVLLSMDRAWEFPELTAEELAAELSALPAILQTSLVPPDIQKTEIGDGEYEVRTELRFHNGGQLIVTAIALADELDDEDDGDVDFS